jgi:RNA polymerase-binding transcription factor
MKQTDTQRFKSILESLRQVLEQPLRRRDEIAVETCPDAIDQVQHASNRELAIRQIEFDSNRLRNLRQAIQRIEEGTYGACIHCGADISVKRLEAVPWTACCLDCQNSVEHQQDETAKEEFIPKMDVRREVA